MAKKTVFQWSATSQKSWNVVFRFSQKNFGSTTFADFFTRSDHCASYNLALWCLNLTFQEKHAVTREGAGNSRKWVQKSLHHDFFTWNRFASGHSRGFEKLELVKINDFRVEKRHFRFFFHFFHFFFTFSLLQAVISGNFGVKKARKVTFC